jgi:hypothetical protein
MAVQGRLKACRLWEPMAAISSTIAILKKREEDKKEQGML